MHFKMSSAIGLNLDQSKTLSSGNGLIHAAVSHAENMQTSAKSRVRWKDKYHHVYSKIRPNSLLCECFAVVRGDIKTNVLTKFNFF